MVMEVVKVSYQGKEVGVVSYNEQTRLGAFEYYPSFIKTGIQLSPLKMPLSKTIYSFPEADFEAFKGLPGLIADSLPDDFGNAVINAWVAAQGKSPQDITPLQRLKYTGPRGMGALTYAPATRLKNLNSSQLIAVDTLVEIAQEIINQRADFEVSLSDSGQEDKQAMMALMSVGMSAGGARPKAVLAFNQDFTQVRSGQTDAPEGFTHYLMKFDGVSEHHQNQQTFGDPMGYGAMEYVYYLMAKNCGIDMMPCSLLNEGNRRHFVTQRYDRIGNQKVHVQTLNAMAHVSYKQVGSFSYAELFHVARQLKLSAQDAEQIFRRMIFNVVARNHDDHAKNVSFLFDSDQQWQLAPAYDLAYSYKPGSKWVNSHWMSINGKRDNFNRQDFYTFKSISALFTKQKVDHLIDHTIEQVSQWRKLALQHHVPKTLVDEIRFNLRLSI
ncbi:type II toxin-antitoxin system HipA family toxin [Aliiglaciecola sp. LCG003]|uniref:type II toxin-antitoxin system HipA family toxin n=1 Tax=Aliiglaciecola sp. LCG003 TaxID=3053655 RepID=UPI0025722B67|nr:type II toxin-antitoxin system HipA family toxin [Aliiglaciecola sp. LCG003]WJG10860.1 type II toxin-antitoxin system HipA family toxin [Aliiglaciecola sp. LCG003]